MVEGQDTAVAHKLQEKHKYSEENFQEENVALILQFYT